MKHLGDISKIHGAHIEPVDLITFGSPCQDLSVAGKRAGLKHETNGDEETTRSGLFMEAIRIIKEMRDATNGKYPRFALWENVPGAFSSNKGEDFRIVLEEIIKIVEEDAIMPAVPKAGWAYADSYSGHGWSLAYRVFDAQHWGVPQRRRRIFLVADFGGECAEEILFKREGLRGNFTQGEQAWQGAATHAESGSGAEDSPRANGSNGAGEQVAACLYAAYGTKWNGNAGAYNGENFVIEGTEGSSYGVTTKGNGDAFISREKHTALSTGGGQAGQGFPCVLSIEKKGKCFGISSYDSNAMKSANPHSGIYEAETSRTLDLNGGNPACNQGGIAVVEPATSSRDVAYAIDQQGGKGSANYAENVMPTLCSDSHGTPHAVAYESHPADSRVRLIETAAPTLTAKYAKLGSDGVIVCAATQQGGAEIRTDDKAPTITAAAGMSGNNQPYVSYSIDKAITTGGNCTAGGSCVNEEVSQTLTTDRPHAVAYQPEAVGIDTYNGCETGEVAATLGVNCGVSTGRNGVMQQTFIIDSIGGQAESARETDIAPTLKATHYKFPPVYAAGFCTEHSANARSVGYQDETSPTLRAGTVPATVYDARGNGNGKTAATITGNHENRITDYSNVVCSSSEAVSLLGDKVAGTLKARDYKGVGRQDSLGSAVCIFDKEVYQSGGKAAGGHYISEGGPAPTLRTTGHPPGICAAGVDCRNGNESPELYPTLQAKPNGGQSLNFSGAVRQDYIVRRLTPVECARLQGFPDSWGELEPKESFTEEEYRFWLDVRNTHAAINGKQVKEYTEKQILSWYNKLHTDSAEYKMWGNGIALPCALYVMQGIAEAIKTD